MYSAMQEAAASARNGFPVILIEPCNDHPPAGVVRSSSQLRRCVVKKLPFINALTLRFARICSIIPPRY